MFNLWKRLFQRKKKDGLVENCDEVQKAKERYYAFDPSDDNPLIESPGEPVPDNNQSDENLSTSKYKIHTPANFARDAILAILDRPMTIGEIALVIPGGEYERTKRQLARMVTKGFITRIERGLYARSPSEKETTTRNDN